MLDLDISPLLPFVQHQLVIVGVRLPHIFIVKFSRSSQLTIGHTIKYLCRHHIQWPDSEVNICQTQIHSNMDMSSMLPKVLPNLAFTFINPTWPLSHVNYMHGANLHLEVNNLQSPLETLSSSPPSLVIWKKSFKAYKVS